MRDSTFWQVVERLGRGFEVDLSDRAFSAPDFMETLYGKATLLDLQALNAVPIHDVADPPTAAPVPAAGDTLALLALCVVLAGEAFYTRATQDILVVAGRPWSLSDKEDLLMKLDDLGIGREEPDSDYWFMVNTGGAPDGYARGAVYIDQSEAREVLREWWDPVLRGNLEIAFTAPSPWESSARTAYGIRQVKGRTMAWVDFPHEHFANLRSPELRWLLVADLEELLDIIRDKYKIVKPVPSLPYPEDSVPVPSRTPIRSK